MSVTQLYTEATQRAVHMAQYQPDPSVDDDLTIIRRLLRIDPRSIEAIAAKARVSPSTLRRWESGDCRRPQNYTLTWVYWALGYRRVLERL